MDVKRLMMRLAWGLAGLLVCVGVQAQTATYSHSGSATATGSGAGGVPSLTFNVQSGQNRVIFLWAAFEREHCQNATSNANNCTRRLNWAPQNGLGGAGSPSITFQVSGPAGTVTLGARRPDLYYGRRWRTPSSGNTLEDAAFSIENYPHALYESEIRTLLGSATSGTITIALPTGAGGINLPLRGGDEAILSAIQFNHVNQRIDGGVNTGVLRSATNTACAGGANTFGGQIPANWSCPAQAYDAGQAPLAGDGLLAVGLNGYARSAPRGFQLIPGFTEIESPAAVNNDTGTWQLANESDGLSASLQWRSSAPMPATAPAMTARTNSGNTTGGFRQVYTIRRALVDLSITKDDGVTEVLSGATTTYTVVVTNNANGNSHAYADGALVRDPAAPGLTKTGVVCVAAGGAVCPVGLTVAMIETGAIIPVLPPGGTLTLSITATITATTGQVTNTATIAPPTGYVDIVPGDNTDSDTNTVISPSADLAITKTNTPAAGANDQNDDVLLSGRQTTYTIVARNHGPSAVTNAVIHDRTEAGLSGCALASPACQVTSGTATCPVVGSGAGQLSIANLQDTGIDGGVRVPNMASDGEVTIRIDCMVD